MILYHYCSQSTFLSIIKNNSFWCSALSLSNDTMEGKWLRYIFSDVCDQNGLSPSHKVRMLDTVDIMNRSLEGLGFCLSGDGDMLSQWRGYAENGEGFSIGFSEDALTELVKNSKKNDTNLQLLKVNYDQDSQHEELQPFFEKINEQIKLGAFSIPTLLGDAGKTEEEKDIEAQKKTAARDKMFEQILRMHSLMYQYKNPAFQEEGEWRILQHTPKYKGAFKHFRVGANRIIPYSVVMFPKGAEAIKEVVLGPKNETPRDVLEMLLEQYGYHGVTVRKSKASYR